MFILHHVINGYNSDNKHIGRLKPIRNYFAIFLQTSCSTVDNVKLSVKLTSLSSLDVYYPRSIYHFWLLYLRSNLLIEAGEVSETLSFFKKSFFNIQNILWIQCNWLAPRKFHILEVVKLAKQGDTQLWLCRGEV